jgi:hypothetical protein
MNKHRRHTDEIKKEAESRLSCEQQLELANLMFEYWEKYRAEILGKMAGTQTETVKGINNV